MALTKQDKEWIALTLRAEMAEIIAPYVSKTNEHEQMLRGVNGDNGINATVRQHNRFIWMLTGGLGLAATTIFYELFIR